MRASANVALQVGAVVVFAFLRLASPGWLLLFLIISVVGMLVPLVPPVLAIVALRRQVLTPALATPFVSCASLLLVGGLTLPDFGDVRSNLLLWTLISGSDTTPVPDAFGVIGMVALLGYLGSVVWVFVALIATGGAVRAPAPVQGPAWGQPYGPAWGQPYGPAWPAGSVPYAGAAGPYPGPGPGTVTAGPVGHPVAGPSTTRSVWAPPAGPATSSGPIAVPEQAGPSEPTTAPDPAVTAGPSPEHPPPGPGSDG